ncbi:MAG: class I SAM-dependent methyltransferase [Lachnospiraceae bacterium]|nr:class I SAM-dependent methyltransferase [Lachnospiraceae bacterium]
MKEYTGFAAVYDMFMDNVPYGEWADYLRGLLTEYGVKNGIVCELGCGTGKMTRKLRDFGYDMIGIDMSQEMLQIAAEHEKEGMSGEILYLDQDMTEFELYGTVAAVVSVCDSMNYITDREDLLKCFRLVWNYLDPGGVFVFDMNTPYYYSRVLGERTICENRDEGSFIWENYYDADTKINEFDLTIYISKDYQERQEKTGKKDGKGISGTSKKRKNDDSTGYVRLEETHYQKAYSIAEVKSLLKKAGLKEIKVYEAMTHDIPHRCSERVYFVAKKVL